jgi:hypothetical protein
MNHIKSISYKNMFIENDFISPCSSYTLHRHKLRFFPFSMVSAKYPPGDKSPGLKLKSAKADCPPSVISTLIRTVAQNCS